MFVFPGRKPYLSHKETIPKTLVSSAPLSGETGFLQITCASLAKGPAYPYQKRGKGGAKLRLFFESSKQKPHSTYPQGGFSHVEPRSPPEKSLPEIYLESAIGLRASCPKASFSPSRPGNGSQENRKSINHTETDAFAIIAELTRKTVFRQRILDRTHSSADSFWAAGFRAGLAPPDERKTSKTQHPESVHRKRQLEISFPDCQGANRRDRPPRTLIASRPCASKTP